MPKITTAKAINVEQLDKELGSQGLSYDFRDSNAKIIITADESNVTQEQLEKAVENHKAQPIKEPTIEEKLALVGLNVDDLKIALGL